MPVDHISIYEVDIAKAFKITVCDIDRSLHVGIIAFIRIADHHAFACEDILDLAYTNVDEACSLKSIQDSLSRRLEAVIMTPYSPGVWPFAVERTGDDTSDSMLSLHYLSGFVAYIIKLFDRDYIFMSCDLKNRISARIYYQSSGFDMFSSIILDDFCAGIWFIAENISAGSFLQLVEYLLRKTVRICRKRCEGSHSCHLPVSDSRILAYRFFLHTAVTSLHIIARIHEGSTLYVKKSEFCKIRCVEQSAAHAGSEGIAAGIAIISRIRSLAASYAVKDYPEYSFAHHSFSFLALSSAIMILMASTATRIARSVSCSIGLVRPAFSLS